MADEIKLKAPTVEQQVVVNINGEEKLKSFADTLEKISNNKNLQKYWKTQQELINATTDAYNNFSKKASQDNAKELIKVTNALKAMSGTDLSGILPDFDKVAKSMSEAQKIARNIDSAFSVKGFKEAFDSFEMLKAYGVDIQNFFSHFGVSSDVGQLQKNVRALENEVEKLTRRLSNAKNANEELRNEFENFKSGSGFADKLDELDKLKSEMSYLREEAEDTFRQFLKLNNISEEGYDRDGFYDDNRFRDYFENIQSGYMSASDAIRQFKIEYSYLLEESFKTNNDTFGLEQLQSFSNKLDSIFRQVEDTSNKINDIISNGVLTKSVENLSVDSSLTDSQRSLFGNILKDEESLKSITTLFQKLIEESNKTRNNEIFNSEQLQQVLSVFDKIESSLSSLRNIISDVGDGEEFSPLLKMINNVNSSISELASNIKGIRFNMNIDVGSNTEMETKVQSKISNALQAYQRLFEHIKMSSVGGSIINTKFFDFDINQYDTMMGKLQAYKKFIDNMRNEAKTQYGKDVLYNGTDKSYWTQASSAMGQVTKAFNEMNSASDINPLTDMFGKTDLSEVVSQLDKICIKLEEISNTASSFKEVFTNGFNVTASVEEIDKLTNRVKELEEELSKVKISSVSIDKSNISSEMKDVFQGSSSSNIEENADAFEQVSKQAEQAKKSIEEVKSALKDFLLNNANDDTFIFNKLGWENFNEEGFIREWLDSKLDIDRYLNSLGDDVFKFNIGDTESSSTSIKEESQALEQVSNSAKDAANSKEKFANANKEVKTSADSSNTSLDEEKKKIKGVGDSADTTKKQLESMQSSVKKYQDKVSAMSYKPDVDHRFPEYQALLNKINAAITDYENHINSLKGKGIINKSDIDKANELEDIIKSLLNETKKFSSGDKGFENVSASKIAEQINKLLKDNSAMSKEAKAQIRAYYNEVVSGNPTRPLKEIYNDALKVVQAEREMGRAGKSFLETIKDKAWYGWAAQLAGTFGVYDIINLFREGVSAVKEFDDGLTKISYTMDMTKSQLDDLGESVLGLASDMKSSVDDAMNVAQIYANMQTSAEEIQKLSEPTLILSNLSGFDSSTIADDIQAVTQQFDMMAEDSMHIADVYDYISRNIAVDYSKGLNSMAEGLQVAGSTAKQAGLDFEQTASIIAKAVEKTRLEGSQVGNGLKTILTRTSKVGKLSDEVDNETLSQASKSLKKIGIEVYNLDGSYREFDVIMGELASKWTNLSDAEKSNISFAIAATRQTNLLSAILSNFSDSMQLAEEATNANGSALENQQKYMNSFSGSLQSLETEAKIAWINILDSDTLKSGIDLLTGLVKVVGELVDKFGLLGTAGLGLSAFAGIKNVGINTLVAC